MAKYFETLWLDMHDSTSNQSMSKDFIISDIIQSMYHSNIW